MKGWREIVDGQALLEYAYDQFEQGVYDAALEAFILAYAKGYEKEWILNTIYNCYMIGNETEFREIYDIWYRSGRAVGYENCLLDFIPYCEGQYFIFDKENMVFRGRFSINSVTDINKSAVFLHTGFSALAAVVDWNWSKQVEVLLEAKYRKVYAICQDINRCGSFFKIPEMAEYAKNIVLFSDKEEFQEYFHEHTSEYLPKLCIGTDEEREALLAIINQEHAYRLTPEGRNTDRVLLTIGIPTYERGNLILKRLDNLKLLPYDSEIEFAISKNGTALYQEEYKSISRIPDALINYIGYDEDLTAWDNCKNVMRIASGKFVLIVSDEDNVIISALEHYLHLLSSNDALGMIRAKTQIQYAGIDETIYYKKGRSALFGGFLKQNYMSGAIYHREKFWKSGIEEWDKKYFLKNSFYTSYPHMWCQVLLSEMGDYMQDNVCLIAEGNSAYEDMKEQYEKTGNDLAEIYQWERNIPVYSTWESRIEQYKDAIEVIRDYADADCELEIRMIRDIQLKTIWLMYIVKQHYRRQERVELINLLLEEFGLEFLDQEIKKRIMDFLVD